MKVIKLNEKYIENLRVMRNENSQWFFDNRSITPEEQQKWYESIKINKKVKFYIIKIDNQVAGALSLTATKEGIEVGNIILDKNFRGKGIMTEAINKLVKNKKGKFYARILLENFNSQNLFERCGFKKTAYIVELK